MPQTKVVILPVKFQRQKVPAINMKGTVLLFFFKLKKYCRQHQRNSARVLSGTLTPTVSATSTETENKRVWGEWGVAGNKKTLYRHRYCDTRDRDATFVSLYSGQRYFFAVTVVVTFFPNYLPRVRTPACCKTWILSKTSDDSSLFGFTVFVVETFLFVVSRFRGRFCCGSLKLP